MRVLVVAKAPVAGQAKTRLGAVVGPLAAARIAAAALVDTLRVATAAAGASGCHLALAGDLDAAVDGGRIRHLLRGWTVTPQRGEGLAERIVNAHQDAGRGTVVQIGMDTPQITPKLLAAAGRSSDATTQPSAPPMTAAGGCCPGAIRRWCDRWPASGCRQTRHTPTPARPLRPPAPRSGPRPPCAMSTPSQTRKPWR